MKDETQPSVTQGRRVCLVSLAAIGASLMGCAASAASQSGRAAQPGDTKQAEVSPGEDLMQEHGVIERILLIYEEAARRIEQQQRVDLGLIARTAHIVQEFVEEYHEQIEERYVFPRLRKANREVNLVGVLLRQHERGRRLTDEILQSASSFAITTLPQALHSYSRMYRPHAAREDTVVFPAFRKLLGRDAYRELGEEFESEEHTRFGEHGFDRVVTDLSQIEAALNISELAAFTPL